MKHIISLKVEKETKGTFRYKEIVEEGEVPVEIL